jgi:phage baseplate assembly protein V
MAGPLEAINRAISNVLARAVVRGIDTASKCQMLQISMPGGEGKSDIEHLEPYGFTSAALEGAEAVAAYFDGDRSHGVVLVVADRRYRLKGLKSGEVAIYDNEAKSVTLTQNGIVVDGGGKPIIFKNATKARFEMDIEATGNITDNCDSGGVSMAQMRVTYNGHKHKENGDGGGITDATLQQMGGS